MSERHPDLRIVIDPCPSARSAEADAEPWSTLIAASAENPNVFAKVSGPYPDAAMNA